MARRVEVVNMEAGYPSAEEARTRLANELDVARKKGVGLLKIIHGYGSTGKGGTLRKSLRTMLLRMGQEGKIGRVIFGEAWDLFDEPSRNLIERYPLIRGDRDLGQSNAGITIVEVRGRQRNRSMREDDD
ncbi:MAG: Smr/MutS family protein [Longimicrobiales bacterium]